MGGATETATGRGEEGDMDPIPGIMIDTTTMTVTVDETMTMIIAMIGMVDGAMTGMTTIGMIVMSVATTMVVVVEAVDGTQTTASGAGAPRGTTTAAAGMAEGEWECHSLLLAQYLSNLHRSFMLFSGTLTKSLERGTRLPSEVLCPTHLSILLHVLPSALINGLGTGHRIVVYVY